MVAPVRLLSILGAGVALETLVRALQRFALWCALSARTQTGMLCHGCAQEDCHTAPLDWPHLHTFGTLIITGGSDS